MSSTPASTVGVKNPAYSNMAIEPWDVIVRNSPPERVRGYFIGETLAYLMRNGHPGDTDRGGLRDLKKARHFLDRLIQYEEDLERAAADAEIAAATRPTITIPRGATITRATVLADDIAKGPFHARSVDAGLIDPDTLQPILSNPGVRYPVWAPADQLPDAQS